MFFAPSKSGQRAKIWIIGVSKTSDHIQIKIKIQNLSQEPSASSKTPNEDLKDVDALCTFKIKIESKNSNHGCIKDHWPYQNQDHITKLDSGTSSILQRPKCGLIGHTCSLHFQNQDRDTKFKSRSRYKPKLGAKGYGCSLSLQINIETKIQST